MKVSEPKDYLREGVEFVDLVLRLYLYQMVICQWKIKGTFGLKEFDFGYATVDAYDYKWLSPVAEKKSKDGKATHKHHTPYQLEAKIGEFQDYPYANADKKEASTAAQSIVKDVVYISLVELPATIQTMNAVDTITPLQKQTSTAIR